MRLYLGLFLTVLGGGVILFLRIESVDLTEGQALGEYWWGWLASAALLLAGFVLMSPRR